MERDIGEQNRRTDREEETERRVAREQLEGKRQRHRRRDIE
jgi:hypothetical protein